MMNKSTKRIWLRAETKPFERRTPLLPQHANILIKNGYEVYVEQSSLRIFSDTDYQAQGCKIVPPYSWPTAPLDAYILGIKELPSDHFPLKHQHLYFAHVYKGQKNAEMILNRFRAGKGVLLDMEYLTDFKGTQLVTKSAGFWAGICGAAITIKIWVQKKQGKTPPFVVPEYYLDYQSLIEELKNSILQVDYPKILIIGPHGMSGSGVRTFLAKMGLNYTEWTRMHTQSAGPYVDILNFDMMFNCIMINNQTPVFLTKESLKRNNKLSIISDISCDPGSPYNPLPLYEHPTSFANPTIRLSENGYPVDIIAIDHITTFLPKESSYALAEQIFPYLCQLLMIGDNYQVTPWEKVIQEFYKHTRKQ